MKIGEHVRRLLGIGTRIKPVTAETVTASAPPPASETRLRDAKAELYAGLQALEIQSVRIRKMLANETLGVVARPGKRR